MVWTRLKRNRAAMAGGVVFAMVLVLAVGGIFACVGTFNLQTNDVRISPDGAHWCGTDDLGRDILARILYGAHLTLGTGLAIVLLAGLAGVPLGLAAAYAGGWFDNLSMRIMDMILAFPSILLALAIVAALGFNLTNIVFAIGLVYMPKFARVTRSAAQVEKSLDYVRAAEALGCGKARILFRHLLPNCIAPVIVMCTLSLATAILEAAALSFLGLGAQPPLPEWGRMLNDGRHIFQTHPHVMVFPGLALALTVLSINLLGDGLRDAFDTRMAQ
ncbi:MAG: ABC transporter permease [Candidatus Sumerlaeaceae bacterium]|nr:ABC transporter permease [Candidatus Sumerlaeaceae bacterium]